MKAAEVESLLRAHYAGTPSKPSAGYFAAEVQAPDSLRRVDALWVPLDTGSRGQLVGHEIKVSRSDVMAELADPMKADAWAKFCDYWWLVVSDPAILDGVDVPEGWGVMSPPSGRSKRLMTIMRKAPRRKPVDQRDAYATVLARIFYNGDDQGAQLRHWRERATTAEDRMRTANDQVTEMRRQVYAAGLQTGAHERKAMERIRTIVALLENQYGKPFGIDVDWQVGAGLGSVTDEEIVQILSAVGEARAAARTELYAVSSSLRSFRAATKEPDVATAIEKLEAVKAELEAVGRV